LQDASFDTRRILVPDYLRQDPAYHGGAHLQYAASSQAPSKLIPEGWVARRWDPAVRARFQALLAALGREFDGKIAGLNLPETSVGFGDKPLNTPPGFTFDAYLEGIQDNLRAARKIFPQSTVIQYANFMPGEWLPWEDRRYLKRVYEFAAQIGAGAGGPDLLPFRKGQQNHSLPLLKAAAGKIPTAIAVQHGNYEERNPQTGRQVTVAELYDYAANTLRVKFLFWSTQEPYFTRRVLPFLAKQ
jgi:hypothetical protein